MRNMSLGRIRRAMSRRTQLIRWWCATMREITRATMTARGKRMTRTTILTLGIEMLSLAPERVVIKSNGKWLELCGSRCNIYD